MAPFNSTSAPTVVGSSGTAGVLTVFASSATVELTGLLHASHALFASITDSTPFMATATNTFTVDLTSAPITIIQPINDSYLNYTSTRVWVTYPATGDTGFSTSTLIIKLDGSPVLMGLNSIFAASATVNLGGLTAGGHGLDASIADYAGNLSTATQVSFTVSLTSPTITIEQPLGGSFVHSNSTTAVVSYLDAGSSGLNLGSLVVKLDGVAVSAGAITAGGIQATVSLTGLAAGAHTLNAYIYDNVGNRTDALQNNFTVDLTVACGDEYFYPSPATGATGNFAYCLALPGTVRIRVYNIVGDLVAKVVDVKPAGPQTSPLNTGRLAPGVYLYLLQKDYGDGNSSTTHTRKFVVRH